jgi:ankyrin repeat protein
LSKNEVQARDRDGQAPLHWAAASGSASAVRVLLKEGADPKAKGVAGMKPLHRAARSGSAVVVEELLSAAADTEARGSYGETPLREGAVEFALEQDRGGGAGLQPADAAALGGS